MICNFGLYTVNKIDLICYDSEFPFLYSSTGAAVTHKAVESKINSQDRSVKLLVD